MNRRFSRPLAAAVLFAGLAAAMPIPLRGDGAAPAAPSAAQIDEAISHLGDDDPGTRDRAAKLLRDAGPAAQAALKAAAVGDDPEVAARARELLRAAPTVPAPAPLAAEPDSPAVQRYRASAPAAKRQIIEAMGNNPGDARTLARAWAGERDAELRGELFRAMLKNPSPAAAVFLADGNPATAELVLESAVNERVPEAPAAYAAYWLARGQLDETIRRWASRGDRQPADAWAERVLAQLWRAKGDGAKARRHASAADDADVLRETLLTTGDWAGLAALLRRDLPIPPAATDLGLLVGAEHFAGEAKAYDADAAKLAAAVTTPQEAVAAAHALLLSDHPDESVRLLIDHNQFAVAHAILIARTRFDEADALLAKHDGETTEEAMWLRCAAARSCARLGEKERCVAVTQRVARENEAPKFPHVYVFLADAERAAGLNDAAWGHFFDAINAVAPQQSAYWEVSQAFPSGERGVDWPTLWHRAIRNNARRPIRQLFDRMRAAYDRTMPIDDLVETINGVDLSNPINNPYAELAWDAVRQLADAKRADEGDKLARRWAEASASGDLDIHLGDDAARNGDWAKAASLYDSAWRKDRSRALPLYLGGWALARGGREAEGRERIERAHLLPLADEWQRQELFRGLERAGLDDAAAREADVLVRTGRALSPTGDMALRTLAARHTARGEHAAAAALWRRALTDFMVGTFWLREEHQYLFLPSYAHRADARALIAAGDLPGAQAQIAMSERLMPNDISIAIDVVPDLEARGMKDEANALFTREFDAQAAVCKRFPNSANEHNQLAWLAAECNRELDAALDHAKRAVELDSTRVAYIDTLAEVYYQRGEFADAVKYMKKCAQMEPDLPRSHTQLAKYEAALRAKAGS